MRFHLSLDLLSRLTNWGTWLKNWVYLGFGYILTMHLLWFCAHVSSDACLQQVGPLLSCMLWVKWIT